MIKSIEHILKELKNSNLKVTPQRLEILEAVHILGNHPSTEEIIHYVQSKNHAISKGTIYRTLETFAEKNIITKVETTGGIFRYDAETKMHHHLHQEGTNKIEDYYDDELNNILIDYFSNKKIEGFKVNAIKLHIKGEFINKQN